MKIVLDKEPAYQLIDTAKVARLAQLDDGNNVHAIPFVFVRYKDCLYSPVDGKPKRHARLSRLAWIEQHPNVTVLIDEYHEDWTRLWWLRIYGEASVEKSDIPEWARVVGLLADKYPQYEAVPMFSGEPTMMRICIDRWRYWAATK